MSNFKKLKDLLKNKGYSDKAAGGIAYKIGVNKYGKNTMQKAAKEGVSAETIKKKAK